VRLGTVLLGGPVVGTDADSGKQWPRLPRVDGERQLPSIPRGVKNCIILDLVHDPVVNPDDEPIQLGSSGQVRVDHSLGHRNCPFTEKPYLLLGLPQVETRHPAGHPTSG